MTPEQAIAEASRKQLRPVYVVVGDETFLANQVVDALIEAADVGKTAGFNIDRWQASDVHGFKVVAAALTVPMMAKCRVVIVGGIEKWDKKGDSAGGGTESLNALADYAAAPADTALVILRGTKVNGSRKLMRAAKRDGFLVKCEPLSRRELPRFIMGRAKQHDHPMDRQVAEVLAELVGPELGPVCDAIERLSLFVGQGKPITEEAVTSTITRVRQQTVWMLIDALSRRDLGKVLRAMADALRKRGDAMPLLGLLRWRVRQLTRYGSERRRGQDQRDAAKAAGVPPFKAAEIEQVSRKLGRWTLERWTMLLAEADLALKGSRRPERDVITTALVAMCHDHCRS